MKISAAVRDPAVLGVKVTATVHGVCGAMVRPRQPSDEIAKSAGSSPPSSTDVIVRDTWSVLASVIGCGSLVLPSASVPKFAFVGLTARGRESGGALEVWLVLEECDVDVLVAERDFDVLVEECEVDRVVETDWGDEPPPTVSAKTRTATISATTPTPTNAAADEGIAARPDRTLRL
jgi:hypothetical protein